MSRFFPNMFVGLKMGVFSEQHRKKMGEALWLFGWIVGRQTAQTRAGIGIVCYGKPLTYSQITHETGWPRGTLRKWMERLELEGYIERKFEANNTFTIRILKAKKYSKSREVSTDLPQRGRFTSEPRVGSSLIPPSEQRRADTPLKFRRGGPRKRQKAFGFIAPGLIGDQRAFPKVSTETTTTILRPAAAALPSPLNSVQKSEEQTEEKPAPLNYPAMPTTPDAMVREIRKNLANLAGTVERPRREFKSEAQIDLERRRQLEAHRKWCGEHGIKV